MNYHENFTVWMRAHNHEIAPLLYQRLSFRVCRGVGRKARSAHTFVSSFSAGAVLSTAGREVKFWMPIMHRSPYSLGPWWA